MLEDATYIEVLRTGAHEAGHALLMELLCVPAEFVWIRVVDGEVDGVCWPSRMPTGARAALIGIAGPVGEALLRSKAIRVGRGPPPISSAPEPWRIDLEHANRELASLEPREGPRRLLLNRLWKTTECLLLRHAREHRRLADALTASLEDLEPGVHGEQSRLDGPEIRELLTPILSSARNEAKL